MNFGFPNRRLKVVRWRGRGDVQAAPLRLEALEERLLPSLTPQMVRDINPGAASSLTQPSQPFVEVNGVAFFSANDGTHGAELWRSNGTAAGTVMVEDIDPGSAGSNPSGLTNVNGTLFFQANDGVHGAELWRSDGTAAGTRMVKDIDPGSAGSNPSGLTNVNGTLFFSATNGVKGTELWRSNGTAAGTAMVKDILPGAGDSFPSNLTNVNGTLFFAANNGVKGEELWRSNGTAAGTLMVKDIAPGSNSSVPTNLTNVSGVLFFEATDGVAAHGVRQLWRSNGTAAGTVLVKDIDPTNTLPELMFFAVNANGTLFFNAANRDSNFELWRATPTSGAVLVKEIAPGLTGSYPEYLTNVSGTLFFTANDATHGRELWRSNGSAAGTELVKDIRRGSGSSYPGYLTNVSGVLFFSADDGVHGREVWRSNGTAAGTALVSDIAAGARSSYPSGLSNVNGTLFFAANDGVHGIEPWALGPVSVLPAASTVPQSRTPGTPLTPDLEAAMSGTGERGSADVAKSAAMVPSPKPSTTTLERDPDGSKLSAPIVEDAPGANVGVEDFFALVGWSDYLSPSGQPIFLASGPNRNHNWR
jgi:ELWxxDGT repeat protein